ncbi:MAG: hypothetical protein K0S07_6 [Chlamydiales bacterium]|jgi:WD40 repeat protein|nr:hypothetical protein [Chlamydiales bacterium]
MDLVSGLAHHLSVLEIGKSKKPTSTPIVNHGLPPPVLGPYRQQTELPPEIWLRIFSYLDHPIDLLRVRHSCRLFKAVSSDAQLWQPLALNLIFSSNHSVEAFLLDQKIDWRLRHKKLRPDFSIPFYSEQVSQLSASSNQLISGSLHGNYCIWDTATGRLLKRVSSLFQKLDFSPTYGQYRHLSVLSGYKIAWVLEKNPLEKTHVAIVDLVKDKTLHIRTDHTRPITRLKLVEERLFSSSRDGTIRVFDANTGNFLALLQHRGQVHRFILSGDKLVSIVGGYRERSHICMWDLTNYQHRIINQSENRALLFTDGKMSIAGDKLFLISNRDGKTIRHWDIHTGKSLGTLRNRHQFVYTKLSAFGSKIALASNDGTVHIGDASSGQMVSCLKGHAQAVTSFCATGNKLFSASLDALCVWDLDTAHLLQKARHGHLQGVQDLTFVGHRLISQSSDSLYIWDLAKNISSLRLLKNKCHCFARMVFMECCSSCNASSEQTRDTHFLGHMPLEV